MATWTTLPDATLEPGKPIRSIDVLALRDNPVAIAEGASGAPRIWGKAAKRLSAYPVLTVSASDALSAEMGAGFVLLQLTVSGGAPVVAARYTIGQYTGSMRFRASHQTVGNLSSFLSLFKNGTLIQTFSTSSETPVARTVDVSIAPSDIMEWRHNGSSFSQSIVTNINVTASNAYQTIPLYIAASDL